MHVIGHKFIVGKPLLIDREFHALSPAGKGVWELKTPDLRLFGWFPLVDVFICDAVATKHQIQTSGLYQGFVNQTALVRQQLGFGRGLFIDSGEPRDAISNCN